MSQPIGMGTGRLPEDRPARRPDAVLYDVGEAAARGRGTGAAPDGGRGYWKR